MSYCRFASKEYKIGPFTIPRSDVYVFESVYGGIECCGCKLVDPKAPSPVFDTYSEMILHLEKHLEAGHVLPVTLIPALQEQIKEHGNEVDNELSSDFTP